jgi:hypothetical protein
MKKILFILITVILFTSCSKIKRKERKLEGTWTISKIEHVYYKLGQPDSTVVINNPGYFSLTQGDGQTFNSCAYDIDCFTYVIYGFANGTGLDYNNDVCCWDTDAQNDDRIVFWMYDHLDVPVSTTVTRQNKKGKDEEWLVVWVDNAGNIAGREVMYVRHDRD